MDDPSITFTPTVVEDDSGSEQVVTGTAELIDQQHVALITQDGTQQVSNSSLHPATRNNHQHILYWLSIVILIINTLLFVVNDIAKNVVCKTCVMTTSNYSRRI